MSRAQRVQRWGIIVLGGGCAGATIVGFAGGGYWLFDLLANLRVHLALGALLAASLALLVGGRRWAAAFAAVALVNVAVVAPLYLDRPAVPADGRRVTIGQLNLRAEQTDPEQLIAAAAANELGDVFVLMEPTRGWNKLLVGKMSGYQVIDLRGRADGLILTKLPVRDVEHPGGTGVLPDQALSFVVDGPDGPISVLAVDAASPGRGRESKLRDRQLSAMADWRAARTGHVVLLGDWNATPWSAAYRELVDRTGLRPAEQGFGPMASYPASLGPLGLPIDHQLHSTGLTVVDARLGPAFHSPHRSLFVTYAPGAPATG